MANAFSKEEQVAFEDICEGFEDALVLSKLVNKYVTDQKLMERSSDQIWRPMPYIAQSFTGADQTSNFVDNTQLSVPASINVRKSVPWVLTSTELRDLLQEGRLGDAAKQKLASDINVSIMNTAANEGTIVVKRTAAASGFADMAEADAAMNEIGVQMFDRCAALSSRDYNNMAANLASRTLGNSPKSLTAYEKAYVGNVSGFETFKLDYANRLSAAAGTSVTVNGASQYHTPAAQSSGANLDNRTQNLAITVGGGTVAVGDCFTIAGVNSVHHITKQDTGQSKTFRITAIVSGAGGSGTVTISPPIISNGGSTDAEAQYQNVSATPANGAAITFLNTVAANVNVFWQKDALEILPGRLVVPADSGVGVMQAVTPSGFQLTMTKQFDIDTHRLKYRLDALYGTVCKQPEMAGIILFSQT